MGIIDIEFNMLTLIPKYGTAALSIEKTGGERNASATGYICKCKTAKDVRNLGKLIQAISNTS